MAKRQLYSTEIMAISPKTAELTKFCGPHIEAETKEEAMKYCEENALGYCKVGDVIDSTPPFKLNLN